MPCFEAPALQSPPASLCMVQTLSSLVPGRVPPPIDVSAPSAIAKIVENDSGVSALSAINNMNDCVSAPSTIANIVIENDFGVSAPSALANIIVENDFCPPAPPAYEADIVQGTDSSTLNSIYIFLTPSFTPLSDMEYVEVYEDERLYVIAADQMVDECMVYCHCGVLYNVPASSAKDGVHPPFFIVTRGRYIGVFCGRHNLAPMVEGLCHAVHAEVDSLEEGERAVRNAIARGETVLFPIPLKA
ncbi:uncharacterized protein HD556DRAFT_1443956 [Suillus plorans]|uniref:Uncharacterized protein n=1 Tax=Suillus plorans TaxID=116603 RepID=A0A9P7ANU1_9AGAM|nr:uncharacterized protein HD556DRAFT_1443956 [Suillus plorans]KAG1793208.1 hypothetical protein HD556DRAFT_1443956 [Suillus plorans]